MTQPPQVPRHSSNDEALRARALADWLKSETFLDGHPNLSTFDFFDALADDDNYLRKEFRINNSDGHPNERAQSLIIDARNDSHVSVKVEHIYCKVCKCEHQVYHYYSNGVEFELF